jgi:hypothetical protein
VNGGKESRKIRGAAARNQREKELREKQKEKEAAATQRAEAARKREARSERRRGEGMLNGVSHAYLRTDMPVQTRHHQPQHFRLRNR